MTDPSPEVVYVDTVQERASRLGTALDEAIETADVTVGTSLGDWETPEDGTPACLIVGADEGTEEPAIAVLETVAESYPTVRTVLLTDHDDPVDVEAAYDAGVAQIVQDAGSATVPILAHHVTTLTTGENVAATETPPHAHLRELLEATDDAIITIDAESEIRYATSGLEAILGYTPAEVVGDSLTTLMGEELATRHLEGLGRYLETGERTLDWTDVELKGRHRDGHEVPLSVSFAEFTAGDERYFTGILRDVSERVALRAERREREERLAQLNELSQVLTSVETPSEVADVVAETAAETLDLPVTAIELYDEETGRLEPTARTDGVTDLVGDGPLFSASQDVPWRVFVESEGRIFDELRSADGVDDDATELESAIVLPLGKHGVFVTGAAEPAAFDDTEVTIANILVSNATAALDRVDREQELRTQKQRLQTQKDALERVERINGVIREITQALTRATSREEIETAVCAELAENGPYTFSWIGSRKSVAGSEVVPRTTAGDGDGYLDAITISTDSDDPTGGGPTGRAFRTQEPQVQGNLHTDPPFEPWQVAAVERDFRSSIAVPLAYDEKLYGVLNIYASQPGTFEDMEVAVLEELGEMVGYAINAMERKKMLVSDTAVALEFELDDTDVPAIRFTQEVGGSFEFDELVHQTEGGYRVFFTITGVDYETVYEYSQHVTAVRDLTFISERADGIRFEATIEESGFLGTLISYGAYPKSMSATEDRTRVEVELPRSGDIQAFIQTFLDTYEGAELVARQERDRPVQTREEFEAIYKEVLTKRQEEVIKTAYFSGFFEWPREKTGQEIAEMLGVSQPTVNRHIRNGERKLMSLLFDDSEPERG